MTSVVAERPAAAPIRRSGLPGALRSEFTKISSLRSTYWALAALVAASLGWTIVSCASEASKWAHLPAQARVGFDPAQLAVIGLPLLGQLVIVVVGALVVTSEYSTQAIRTSLIVVPRRGVLYAAKTGMLTVLATAVAFATSFVAFFTGQWLLASTHAAATLTQPNVLRSIAAAAVFVVLCGLFSIGLGTLLRSTAATLATAYGFLFLLPELIRALPSNWYHDTERWLPGGQFIAQITNTEPQPVSSHLFSAWGEIGVFAGYTVVMLIAGAVALHRRDA
jgi:ABC-2 type transport system permease protein